MTPTQIKRLRKSQRWSQQDLAQRLGTTVTQVSRWETGRQAPGYETEDRLGALARGEQPAPTVETRLAELESRVRVLEARNGGS